MIRKYTRRKCLHSTHENKNKGDSTSRCCLDSYETGSMLADDAHCLRFKQIHLRYHMPLSVPHICQCSIQKCWIMMVEIKAEMMGTDGNEAS